jgi:hypothetical protein
VQALRMKTFVIKNNKRKYRFMGFSLVGNWKTSW